MSAHDRVVWIDAARGICVIAVVTMHATLSLYLYHVPEDAATSFWAWTADAMTPFRMPGLAMLSGMLLARRIQAGWPAVRAAVANSAWLYVVWLLLFALFAWEAGASVWTAQLAGGDGFAWEAVLAQLVLPRTVLWYVFALAVWTALLTSVRRLPPSVVIGVLVAVSIASRYLAPEDGDAQIRNVLRYALFFAIGALGAGRLRAAIDRGDRRLLGAALWVFVGAIAITLFSRSDDVEHVLSAPRDAAAGILLLLLVARVCRGGRVGTALGWLGRRTLPVYVMHALLFDAVLRYVPGWDAVVGLPVLDTIGPLVLALAAAAVCVGLYELVMRTPDRVLFGLPGAVRRRLLAARTDPAPVERAAGAPQPIGGVVAQPGRLGLDLGEGGRRVADREHRHREHEPVRRRVLADAVDQQRPLPAAAER